MFSSLTRKLALYQFFGKLGERQLESEKEKAGGRINTGNKVLG